MSRSIISLFVALIVSCQTTAQAPENDKPAYLRFIGPKTMMFVHYRAGELLRIPAVQTLIAGMPGGKEQMAKEFQKDLGINPEDVDTVTMFLDEPVFVDGQPQPPRPSLLLISKKDIDFTALRRSAGPTQKTIQYGKYELTVGARQALVRLDERSALVVPETGGNDVEALKKENWLNFARPDADITVPQRWQQSVKLAITQKYPFFMGFHLPPELSKLAEEQFKTAPAMAAPFKALTKVESGYMAMSYDATQATDCQFKIVAHFPDARSAQAGLGAVKFALASGKMAINSLPNQETLGKDIPRNVENFWAYSAAYSKKQIELIKTEQKENEVIITYPMNSKEFLPVITLAIEKVRLAANRMRSGSNMRQLMIGMHNYHSDYGHLPPVISLKEGKQLHSWRVHLPPYLDEDKLYRQLRIDEPWDSEHNKKVFESNPMPKIFVHPQKGDADAKKTYYQVFYSQAGARKPAGLRLGIKFTLGQLVAQDGASNTIAMIENGKPVPWYKPEDIEFDAIEAFPKLSSPWSSNKVQVAFFDGSIRTFILGKDEATWKALVTWNGGEEIDFSKIEE